MGSANETTTIKRPRPAVARPGFTCSSDRPIIISCSSSCTPHRRAVQAAAAAPLLPQYASPVAIMAHRYGPSCWQKSLPQACAACAPARPACQTALNFGSDSFPLLFCGDLVWCSRQEHPMVARFGFALLIPPGLEVNSVDDGEDTLVVTARSSAATASCPLWFGLAPCPKPLYPPTLGPALRRAPCAPTASCAAVPVRRARLPAPSVRRTVRLGGAGRADPPHRAA
jgi:hypothetical protein